MKKRQQPPKRKLVRYGVYLPVELRRNLLKAAIDEGISATRIVEQLIKDHLVKRGYLAKRPKGRAITR